MGFVSTCTQRFQLMSHVEWDANIPSLETLQNENFLKRNNSGQPFGHHQNKNLDISITAQITA